MLIFNYKILSFSNPLYNLIIPSIAKDKPKTVPLEKIQYELQKANPALYEKSRTIIRAYKENKLGHSIKKIDDLLLWQFVYKHKRCFELNTILYYDKELLSIFNDPYDLLRFTRNSGLAKVLDFFCFDNNRSILLKRFSPVQIFKMINANTTTDVLSLLVNTECWKKLSVDYGFTPQKITRICSNQGSAKVLKFLTTTKNWKTLTSVWKFDLNDIYSIAIHIGSSKVLELLAIPENRDTLTQVCKLNTSDVVKIASNNGSRKVFEILLDPQKWRLLTSICELSLENIVKIACHDGARNVFEIFLNHMNWYTLRELYEIDIPSIVKIASHNGAKSVLSLLLDPKNWQILTEIYKLDTASIVKISKNDGSRNVLELLLDLDNWITLTNQCKLKAHEIIRIACYAGSKNVLALLLDKNNWKILTEKYLFQTKTITRIASNIGARNVLTMLLNPKNEYTLLGYYKLNASDLAKMLSHGSASYVLKTLLDHKNWETLRNTYNLNTDDIIKISSYLNSSKVFEILLNPEHWKTLTETYQIDTEQIIEIAKQASAHQVLTILLNPKHWKTLTEKHHLSTQDITQIASQLGSQNVLEILLNPHKWKTLTESYRFNICEIVSIASSSESKSLLDRIINSKNFTILTQDFCLESHTLTSFLTQNYAHHILDTLLDPKNHKTLCQILGKNMVFKTMPLNHILLHLDLFIQKHENFHKHFDSDLLSTILQLHEDDQNGLSQCLDSPLKKSLHFSQIEILSLARIAGRHLPYIFNIIYSTPDTIHSLFSNNGLPLSPYKLPDTDHSSIQSSFQEHWIMTLVELHSYLEGPPLSLEELHFLKSTILPNSSYSSSMAQLQRLILLISKAPQTERMTIWASLQEKKWIHSDAWLDRLTSLSYPLRKWFILEGLEKLSIIFKLNVSQPQLSTQDQSFILHCLQSKPIRTYIEQTFHNELKTSQIWNPKHYSLNTSKHYNFLSSNDTYKITAIDWIFLTIKTYTLLDNSLNPCNSHEENPPPTTPSIFTKRQLSIFKKDYPIFHYNNGSILSSIPFEQLTKLLFEITPSHLTNESRKRHSPAPPEPCLKKSRIATDNVPASSASSNAPAHPLFWNLSTSSNISSLILENEFSVNPLH